MYRQRSWHQPHNCAESKTSAGATPSKELCKRVCVCVRERNTLIAKSFVFSFLISPFLQIESRGARVRKSGRMEPVCDLDQHSVKGPGVAATYHVPSAEDLVSSCDFNMHSQLDFHSTAMCYPVFLPSKAESNLIFVPAVRQCLPRSRVMRSDFMFPPSTGNWLSVFPHGLAV